MRRNKSSLLLFLFMLAALRGFSQNDMAPPIAMDSVLYSLYLVGDVGDNEQLSQPVLKSLENQLKAANNKKTGIAFLGDNIYPNGLNKKKSSVREKNENRLNVQLEILKNFIGDIFFIPGNHDWDKQGRNGYKQVKRQEDYIQKYLDKGNTFRPSHGCPGPDVVKVGADLVLIILDTQWWLHAFDKPTGENDGCEVSNEDELMVAFREALKKNRDKKVVVLAHHPLVSNGEHGGYQNVKSHIFPLTAANKNLYIPLPVIGSIYPTYRKYIGHPQDIAHPKYTDMVRRLKKAMNEYDNITYVAGHEHNLQHIKEDRVNYVISGSGSKSTYVRHNKRLLYGAKKRGYARLAYTTSGQMWLEFMTFNTKLKQIETTCRTLLYQKTPEITEVVIEKEKHDYSNQFVMATPDSTFAAGKLQRFFMGDLNRDIWTTPLKIPYLNIDYEKGGLTPIKKGGGMQSISLRMQGGDGKQYVLRGVKKNADFLIERNLRGTIAQDIIYDGLSASHPYASIALSSLSDAADIYHTNPKLVYVPKDSVLGDYLDQFGGMFCVFEERPDEDMSDIASFGNSKKVLSYNDVIKKTQSKYKHIVDYEYIVRARLFDILIGDWDRHDDQWRWAKFKKGKKTIYRPIPRDRDQAFFKADGIALSIANRKWLARKFQPFQNKIRDIDGYGFNARYFDRSNLIEADKSVWQVQAKKLQMQLTDSIIESSIHNFPQAAFDISGEEIISILKVRRDSIANSAERLYASLSKYVDIPGTFKNDYFEVKRLNHGKVEVNIYPRKKGKKRDKKRYYHRIFNSKETKEIRLYGLGGNDEFKIEGHVKKSILVRIITGEDKNKVVDKSSAGGIRRKTHIYSFNKSDKLETAKESRVRYIKKSNHNYEYNRKEFLYDKLVPGVSLGFNPNDGLVLGPALTYTKQGFKKKPFKTQHKISVNRTFGAHGYNIYYDYKRTEIFGPFDFHLMTKWNRPFVYQFYGRGNEVVELDDDFTEYNVRMNDFEFRPSLNYSFLNNTRNLNLSFDFRRTSFNDKPLVDMPDWETEDQKFVGLSLAYENENKDSKINPSRGTHLKLKGSWTKGLRESPVKFFRIQSSVSFYTPLNIIQQQTVLAFRSGFSKNFGTHSFFQSNFLDGYLNFRGVRRNRFAGNAALFYNLELRQSLFKVYTYTAPLDVGVLAHFDMGKVWEKEVKSARFHNSFGGGAFINVLDYFMLMGTYSVSNPTLTEENHLLTIGTSFLF